MTMLTIIQAHTQRTGLPVPTSVQSSSDPQVVQMVGLLQECFDDLVTRKAWQQNTVETTFVSTAAEDQGAITTICPLGFQGILPNTVFDRTQRLPLCGGLTPAEWQARKAFNMTGPLYDFRIRRNRLLFNPALPVDHTIAFEYFSSYFALAADGITYRQYLLQDTDTCTLDNAIPTAYLRWRWKAQKGFDYAEEFRQYELLVNTALARNNSPRAVNIGCSEPTLQPGIFIPAGSYPLS